MTYILVAIIYFNNIKNSRIKINSDANSNMYCTLWVSVMKIIDNLNWNSSIVNKQCYLLKAIIDTELLNF